MRRLWADSRPRGALFVLLSVGPVLAGGWCAQRIFRPNGLGPMPTIGSWGRRVWVPDHLPRLDVAHVFALVQLPLHLN